MLKWVNDKWQSSKIRRYRYGIMATAVLVASGVGAYFLETTPLSNGQLFFNSAEDRISYYGFSLTICTILLAIKQAVKNHDWNRRVTASTQMAAVKEKLDPKIRLIHNTFGYTVRDEVDTIKVKEIHDKVCVKDENDRFVQDETTKLFILKQDDESVSIHRAIWDTLNIYEHLAACVYHGIYDKEFVADLHKSNIIKIASVFSEYIKHVNNDMYKERKGEVWKNIRTLSEEFTEKYRDKPNKAKQREHT